MTPREMAEHIACVGRYRIGGARWTEFVTRAEKVITEAIAAATAPQGWRLIKDSTFTERNFPEDAAHENGNYHRICSSCERSFVGHKRRFTCKVCQSTPPVLNPADAERNRVEAEKALANLRGPQP